MKFKVEKLVILVRWSFQKVKSNFAYKFQVLYDSVQNQSSYFKTILFQVQNVLRVSDSFHCGLSFPEKKAGVQAVTGRDMSHPARFLLHPPHIISVL